MAEVVEVALLAVGVAGECESFSPSSYLEGPRSISLSCIRNK